MEGSLRRREFLAVLGALGATALASEFLHAGAQAPAAAPRRIDLHHHFAAPPWAKRHKEVGRQGWETFQDYTPAKS